MDIKRTTIIKKFPWLKEKKRQYIISASYEGLICASFLNHFLDWELIGYYDLEKLWISDKARKNKQQIIWVDLNILPIQGRAIGGHIVACDTQVPKGFNSSCNPFLETDILYQQPLESAELDLYVLILFFKTGSFV